MLDALQELSLAIQSCCSLSDTIERGGHLLAGHYNAWLAAPPWRRLANEKKRFMT